MTQLTTPAQKLAALRAVLQSEQVDGFVIPKADEYLNEFVPAATDRLRWITHFTGSAGISVVLKDKAVAISDGRYALQVRSQTDPSLFEAYDSARTTAAEWIAKNMKEGDVIGYDPLLHTSREIRVYEDRGIIMKPLDRNPVDVIWTEDRPAPPATTVELFPMKFAGVSSKDKLDQIAVLLKQKKLDAAVITLSDSIAWMLNIRANDIPHTPIALSYALARSDGTLDWFIDEARVPEDVRASFGNRVSILPPPEIQKSFAALKGKNVLVDEARTSIGFVNLVRSVGAVPHDLKEVSIELKAIKNTVEQDAMRAANLRDSVAYTKFLKWLDEEAPNGKLTEMEVEDKLEAFRRAVPEFRELSFDTICSTGPNGAIIHYRVTPESNRVLDQNNLLLIDSGAQYEDGTIDMTRTIAIGTPTDEMKKRYTLVLKAHIAVDNARFPVGTTGAQIDAMGRGILWANDMDFPYGTGHGVGCYLSVHEEAARLSPRLFQVVEEGMILSNEPGYHKEGAFGLRIENLMIAQKDGVSENSGKNMLCFETITLVPMEMKLIVREMLSPEENTWLDSYHDKVFAKLSPSLDDAEKAWLKTYMR